VLRARVFLVRVGLPFDELFVDCFFLTGLFRATADVLRDVFFACFEPEDLGFPCLLFAFVFLDGMAAVYHRGRSPPQRHEIRCA
jgi:hypothetical protein